MPKTKPVNPGDRVTLRSGRKVGTDYTPGTADLRGVSVQVVDAPAERYSAADDQVQERVHVRPILPTGKLGIPLDIPVSRIRDEDRSASRSLGFSERAKQVIGSIFGGRTARERGVVRSTTVIVGGKRVTTETQADGSEVTREE